MIILLILLIQFSYLLLILFYYSLFLIDYSVLLSSILYILISSLLSINNLVLNALFTVLLINIGFLLLIIALKQFIIFTLIVGNIIDIYILGLIVVLINYFTSYVINGIIIVGFLFYFFITTNEVFIVILFILEFFSLVFQSITITNRLSINLLAGTLVITLTSIGINYITSWVLIGITVLLFLCTLWLFELLSTVIQLFIFTLLTIEYQ